jgi:hypothetical protein
VRDNRELARPGRSEEDIRGWRYESADLENESALFFADEFGESHDGWSPIRPRRLTGPPGQGAKPSRVPTGRA